jgi:hypothetical protein
MFGSEVIDVAVGIALLFLFMSVIATALREIMENFMKSRSKDLERGIKELLSTPNAPSSLVNDLYRHPIIASLYKGDHVPGGKNLPSYIPRRSFSLALLDLLAKASVTGSPLTIEGLRAALAQANPPNNVQRVVLIALGNGAKDLDAVRAAIEDWYDGTMDRVSGWYARRTGRILAVIGFCAAVAFNVDAITVAQHLITDKALRQAVLSQAATMTAPAGSAAGTPSATADPALPTKSLGEWSADLNDIGFPIGWKVQDHWIYPAPQTCILEGAKDCSHNVGWLIAFFGWIITALAIMLGAPFWFDVLNKFMVVRSTVKPKEKSPDEASADAQPNANMQTPPSSGGQPRSGPSSPSDDAVLPSDGGTAAALAVSDGAFTPHEWVNNADPQAGVM